MRGEKRWLESGANSSATRAGRRGCGKMAAAESNRARCADVPCGEDAMTTTKTPTPTPATEKEKVDAVAPRRRLERYRFRIVDLLYYALSVSFFFADVATGEQRVLSPNSRMHRVSRDFAISTTSVKFSGWQISRRRRSLESKSISCINLT